MNTIIFFRINVKESGIIADVALSPDSESSYSSIWPTKNINRTATIEEQPIKEQTN